MTNLQSNIEHSQSKPRLHGWTKEEWYAAANFIFPRRCRAARETFKAAVGLGFSPAYDGLPSGVVFVSHEFGAGRAKVNPQSFQRGIQDCVRCGLLMPEHRILRAKTRQQWGCDRVAYRLCRPGTLDQLHLAIWAQLQDSPTGKKRMSDLAIDQVVATSGRLYSADIKLPPVTRLALWALGKGDLDERKVTPSVIASVTPLNEESYTLRLHPQGCNLSPEALQPKDLAGTMPPLNALELSTECNEYGECECADARPPRQEILSPKAKPKTKAENLSAEVRTVLEAAELPEVTANIASVEAALRVVDVATLSAGVSFARKCGAVVNRFWFDDGGWREEWQPTGQQGRIVGTRKAIAQAFMDSAQEQSIPSGNDLLSRHRQQTADALGISVDALCSQCHGSGWRTSDLQPGRIVECDCRKARNQELTLSLPDGTGKWPNLGLTWERPTYELVPLPTPVLPSVPDKAMPSVDVAQVKAEAKQRLAEWMRTHQVIQ